MNGSNLRVEDLKDSAIEKINSIGLLISKSDMSKTEIQVKVLRSLVECLSTEYLNYLLAVKFKASSIEELHRKYNSAKEYQVEEINESYLAVVANEKLLFSLIKKYDAKKGDFFNHFETYAAFERKGRLKKLAFLERRKGIINVFSEEEERRLMKLLKFMEENSILSLNSMNIKDFCDKYNYAPEKINKIWQKNIDSNCVNLEEKEDHRFQENDNCEENNKEPSSSLFE